MKLKLFQVDAFAQNTFEGNPAAVCPLDKWLDEALLQQIAQENNLSETAFFVPFKKGFQLRWFTPLEEVDLCGHATLAAAHVLFTHLPEYLTINDHEITFYTHSGELRVSQSLKGMCMDFPSVASKVIAAPSDLLAGLNGMRPLQVLAGSDYLVILENEQAVKDCDPDFSHWGKLDLRGVIITAKGLHHDFVSRCFFPKLGVDEDPVTGSAHCQLVPYWHQKLNINQFHALQASKRSGQLNCEIKGDRILLTGKCVDYLIGEIHV